jgi:hypothetical protein
MSVSFFEEKIKQHQETYPNLLQTEWISYQDVVTKVHHLEPGMCGYYKKNAKVTNLIQNSIVTAQEILNKENMCKKCLKLGLSAEGFTGKMLGQQIKIIETNDLPKLIASFWQGRNRTITEKTHSKLWKEKIKPLLEESSSYHGNICSVTYGSLHYAKIDKSIHYKHIISNIANGFIYKSPGGGIWVYSTSKPLRNEYEKLLEQDVPILDKKTIDSLVNLGELCDNALKHGGWDDINYWWEIAKRI